jgi:hypothetical protein
VGSSAIHREKRGEDPVYLLCIRPRGDRKNKERRDAGWNATKAWDGRFVLTRAAKTCDYRGMEINIPDEKFQKLTERAHAEGYPNAAAFIESLAEESVLDPRRPLSDAQLSESVAQLRAADASIDAGQGLEASEALRRITAGHRFAIDG